MARDLLHSTKALPLERDVPYREDLIDKEDFRLKMRGNGKS